MIAGRYRLERVVGRGGMGAVWLGVDTVLGREVALKELAPVEAGGATTARAAREARLAARLSHRDVVTVFDLVEHEGRPWLVMEYVSGTTLAGLVDDGGPLSPDAAAGLLVKVVDGLRAAHRAGVVHRDVKPSNILVSPDGQVKLTDFGIARGTGGDMTLTQTGMVTGSPSYLSPEVASGQPATPASDVWSLGATLYFAITGQPPYDATDHVLGTLYRIVHEDPPRTDRAGRLAPLLAGTMQRDPDQRWSLDRVHDFLIAPAEMTQALPITPVTEAPAPSTPPPSVIAPEPTASPSRGRAGRRAGLALLVLLLLVAAGGGLWLGLRAADDGSPAADPATESADATGPSTDDASSGPAETSESDDPGPTADGVTGFVENYLSTAAADPQASYAMLTPEFQAASGGIEGYAGWWDPVERIDSIESITPQLGEDLGVDYTYTYTREGSTTTESVHLSLVYQDGTYLIAGQ